MSAKKILHITFSYTNDVEYIAFETIVVRYTTVGYWVPNRNEICPTDETGFSYAIHVDYVTLARKSAAIL